MKLDSLPAPILAKLLRLDEEAEALADRVQRAADSIISGRARLQNGAPGLHQREHDDLLVAVRAAIDEQPRLVDRRDNAHRVARACKSWIQGLPENTELVQMEVDVNGHTLGSVRFRLKDCQEEIERLRRVPEPSADIEKRVKEYVRSLGRPKVEGIEAGATPRVSWPESGATLAAFLAPDTMIRAVMAEVERMANDPMPPAQRKKRMAALGDEIRDLQHVEQALIWASEEYIEREQDTPAWAILGAAVVVDDADKKTKRSRERASA